MAYSRRPSRSRAAPSRSRRAPARARRAAPRRAASRRGGTQTVRIELVAPSANAIARPGERFGVPVKAPAPRKAMF